MLNQLCCQIEGHQKNNVKWVCMNSVCQFSHHLCQVCYDNQTHKEHFNEIMKLEQLEEKKLNGEKLIKNINQTLDVMKNLTDVLKQYIVSISEDLTLNFSQLPKPHLQAYLCKQQIAESLFSQEVFVLEQTISQILKKYSSLSIEQKSIFETKLQDIQIQKQLEKKILASQFQFSKENKNSWVEVKQDGKLAQGSYICVVEPAIQKSFVHRLSFRIINTGGSISLGICDLSIVKQNKFEANITSTGHGCYLIQNDGETYSHHDQNLNYTRDSFKFNDNDIINVEVDLVLKLIQWSKKGTNETYSMKFIGDQDLYPCVKLCYAKVELIEE